MTPLYWRCMDCGCIRARERFGLCGWCLFMRECNSRSQQGTKTP